MTGVQTCALPIFVSRAMVTDWTRVESLVTHGSVDELKGAISQGLRSLGDTCADALNVLLVVENTSPPTVLTAVELEILEKKMQKKNKVKNPFAEKASNNSR